AESEFVGGAQTIERAKDCSQDHRICDFLHIYFPLLEVVSKSPKHLRFAHASAKAGAAAKQRLPRFTSSPANGNVLTLFWDFFDRQRKFVSEDGQLHMPRQGRWRVCVSEGSASPNPRRFRDGRQPGVRRGMRRYRMQVPSHPHNATPDRAGWLSQ